MYRLGIDLGSSSAKLVLLDEGGTISYQCYAMHGNKVAEVVREHLTKIQQIVGEQELLVGVSGEMAHLLGLPEEATFTDVIALAEGVKSAYPQAESCISIGATGSLYLEFVDKGAPIVKRNSNCSAGTGSFFEEQASRLQIPLEAISDTVCQATSVPRIAGRCSVFSKTDIIHHMQEGAAPADLLKGLCFAMVRNYKASILRNQNPALPVVLDGGVKRNAGVVEALQDLFTLDEESLLGSSDDVPYQALGCAQLATQTITVNGLLIGMEQTASKQQSASSVFAPLASYALPGDEEISDLFVTSEIQPCKASLGIDIGSASINLVLVDDHDQVMRYRYLRNIGKPLETLREALDEFCADLPEGIEIVHRAITGSGREYVGKQIGADFVINEITAQAMGAAVYRPEVDTIFEIGGQDSKYVSLVNGNMRDFEMNKVCAAGTGTFLEEQVRKLGLSMEDFVDLAMSAKHPCQFGDRCTVFIEGSVNRAIGAGVPLPDVCAGLVYAVAANYLHRVVNGKRIGKNVAVQGGIAYNQAVVCAFRALTGADVRRSKFFSVTGAVGAAVLAARAHALNLDKKRNQELNRQLLKLTEESYLDGFDANAARDPRKKTVGIPRVIFLNKMFPLFKAMFQNLGYNVVLSPRSTRETVAAAREYATEETCYPIKLIYGHIAWLLDQGVDYIVLPRLFSVVHRGSKARVNYSCMYMQTSPLLMDQAFHFKERGVKLISPKLSLNFGKRYMVKTLLGISGTIGVLPPRMIPAALTGVRALFAHSERLEKLTKDYLESEEPVFVLMSRVYNIADPMLNMGIERHLDAMGCRVIHLEHLEASTMNVEHRYENLYWPFGQHLLTGFGLVKDRPNLFPIYITNHGCGPDTAIQHYIKDMMGERPYLHLEVDEHASGVGVVTRLEAYLYEVANYLQGAPLAASTQPSEGRQSSQTQTESDMQAGKSASAVKTSQQVGQVEASDQGAGNAGAIGEAQPIELVPEFGAYTELLKQALDASDALVAPALQVHGALDYAINKEYHSLLVNLEELIGACEPDKRYTLKFPTYEGAEVWGQYGLLIAQELRHRGIDVTLESPFLEDLLRRRDIVDLYNKAIRLEQQGLDQAKATEKPLVMAIGEPSCVYKEAIFQRATQELNRGCAVVPMPLSEALLLFWTDIDRKHEHDQVLRAMRKLHDEALVQTPELYNDWDKLLASVNGRLSFCAGGFGRYRFAKMQCLGPGQMAGIVAIASSEENVTTILKSLEASVVDRIALPICRVDIDHDHTLSAQDARSFLHYLG